MKLQACIPQWDDNTWSEPREWLTRFPESFAEWYAKEKDHNCTAINNPIVVHVRDESGKVTKYSVDAEVIEVEYTAYEITDEPEGAI